MNIFEAIIIGVISTLIGIITGILVGKDKKKSINNVHFYVARDKNRSLWVYMCKPVRNNDEFKATTIVAPRWRFEYFGLNENDYANLKWEDEPVEVFLNLGN